MLRKVKYIYLLVKVTITEKCYIKKFSNSTLLDFYFNKYSQAGQDGILKEIFRRLGIKNGIFVENGWTGVFIEGNPEKFRILKEKYQSESIIKIK